MVSGDIKLL